MLLANRSRAYATAPYMVLGVVLWAFMHESGLQATLSVPDQHPEQSVGAKSTIILRYAMSLLREPGFHLQHRLEPWAN